MGKEYKVTAYCLAFNHEKYIRKTLEGFVSQKTDFGFKVIVHDDASTDGTADIIREYAQKYPDIIFPILQTENQYSRGVRIFYDIILPMVDTEYLAICEGDDYWSDENKLQLQYDLLQAHPEYRLSVHNTLWIDGAGESLEKYSNPGKEDRELSADDIIEAGGGGLFHTSSVMYHTRDRRAMPAEYTFPGVGDYPLAIYFADTGKVHYTARVMSAYRTHVGEGWTSRLLKNKKKYVQHMRNTADYLHRINHYTECRHKDAFAKAAAKYQVNAMEYGSYLWRIPFDRYLRAELKRRYPTLGKRLAYIAKAAVKGLALKLGLLK